MDLTLSCPRALRDSSSAPVESVCRPVACVTDGWTVALQMVLTKQVWCIYSSHSLLVEGAETFWTVLCVCAPSRSRLRCDV